MKKLFCLLISFGLVFSVYSADVFEEGSGADVISGSDSPSDIDILLDAALTEPIGRLLQEYRQGAEIEYSSATTITVSAGQIAVQNANGSVVAFLDNTSSTSVTFSNLDTGDEAASTTYYVYGYSTTPASDTDFDITISTSSTAPFGATQYARLGSFYNNSSSNIEQVKNDDYVAGLIVATGTIAHGATISLPSGYVASQCKWTVSTGKYYHQDTVGGGGEEGSKYHETTVNSSRVVTCRTSVLGYGTNQAHNGVANYMIVGYR